MTNESASLMRPLLNGRWAFQASLAFIVICFLFTANGYPIQAIPQAGYDDGLFFRALASISGGEWLGAYDHMTLAKGPFLSILGALSASVSVEAKFLEAILYATMAVAFSLFALRLGLTKYLALALIILLLSNPHIWSIGGRRYLREIVYASSAMMTLLLMVCMCSARGNKTGALYAVGMGCFSGLMYLTREEDIWMIICITIVFGLAALRDIVRNGLRSLLSSFGSLLIRSLCALVGLAAIVGPVLVLNYSYYGRAIVSEFRAPEFKAAVGALMRVGDIHPSGVVPVSQATMQLVLDTAPAAGTLRPHWPGVANRLSQHGKDMLSGYSGEIAGGWFVWALRDAAALAGHHRSAQDARRFYSQLAAEVNAACDAGVLVCRSRRDTLRPELPAARIPELIEASWRALVHTVFLSSKPIKAPRSNGDRAALERWAKLIGPVVGNPTEREYELAGWVAHRAAEPMIAIPNGSTVRIRELTVYPGADVISHFRKEGVTGLRASRFRMTVLCPDVGCAIAAVSQNGDISVFPLDKPAPGSLKVDDRFLGHMDSVQQRLPLRLSASPFEELRETVISFFTTAARIIVPILVLASTLGLLGYLFVWKGHEQSDWLVILTVGAAVAVMGRCVIIAYIDITSWRAISTVYLGPAYPFVIVYAIAGTQLLLKGLDQSIPSFQARQYAVRSAMERLYSLTWR